MDSRKRLRLTELVATLPVGAKDTGLSSSIETLDTAPAAVDGYVLPRVRVNRDVGNGKIALLTAPGAVGKSAAARWIAENRGWFLVDGAQLQVGDHAMTGLLRKALGRSAQVFQMIEDGDLGFVVDALDEALIKANIDGLFAFVDDILSLAADGREGRINTILVAREDVAELIRLHLDMDGVEFADWTLDFFDYSGAFQMLATTSGEGRPLDEPSRRLAEDRMVAIAEALLGREVESLVQIWPKVEGFLGYAPVLGVLAAALDTTNPYRALMSGEQFASGEVLRELVESLLRREQTKFVGAKAAELRSKTPTSDPFHEGLLFSTSEQVRRLYARMMGSIFERAGSPVPDSIWNQYKEAADQWFMDHPAGLSGGVASQVFRDFVLAQSWADEIYVSPRDVVEQSVGRFFAPFVHANGTEVPEWLVPLLIESSLQGRPDAREWFYSQAGEKATLEIADPLGPGRLSFRVRELTGLLEVGGRGVLGRGMIVTDQAVRLGGAAELVVSGGLHVFARDILVASPLLQVAPPGLFLHCDEGGDAASLTHVRAVGDASIQTVGMMRWPILRQFDLQLQPLDFDRLFSAAHGFADLRALLRDFRKTVHDVTPSVAEVRLQQVIGRSERRAKYRDRLVDLGVIERRGKTYLIDPDGLSSRGVSYDALCRGQLSDQVFELLLELEGPTDLDGPATVR